MRKYILAILILGSLNLNGQTLNERKALLIKAIALRESTYKSDTINIKENAVGYLGIRPIMVAEVNRILKKNKYTLKDRLSKKKSIEMFIIYQNYWNPKWIYEIACRIWNGGPRGMFKKETIKYWKDILNDKIIKK